MVVVGRAGREGEKAEAGCKLLQPSRQGARAT